MYYTDDTVLTVPGEKEKAIWYDTGIPGVWNKLHKDSGACDLSVLVITYCSGEQPTLCSTKQEAYHLLGFFEFLKEIHISLGGLIPFICQVI